MLSLVGLLPALIVGLDAEAVRAGAAEVLAATLAASNAAASEPARGAAIAVALARHSGIATSVIWPYSNRLAPFGLWYRQLWAESLGKGGAGTTPVMALGPVDQHSQLQLYLDGPADKMFTLITTDSGGRGALIDPGLAGENLAWLGGRRIGDVIAARAGPRPKPWPSAAGRCAPSPSRPPTRGRSGPCSCISCWKRCWRPTSWVSIPSTSRPWRRARCWPAATSPRRAPGGGPVVTIRVLPQTLVDRIAAGEVVERPASAVKELVENAIDAGARRVDVVMSEGGRDLISATDDGAGMTANELALAVQRHATSKLPDDDLLAIRDLGFRGEALPSIGAVSRLALTSRRAGAPDAWSLTVADGNVTAPVPAAHAAGTRVEVRGLFRATPARLKFLKAPRTEFGHAIDVVKRLALARPDIAFTLADETRTRCASASRGRSAMRPGPASPPSWGASSSTMRSLSMPPGTTPDFPASRRCRPSAAPAPKRSTCSSTAAPCATVSSPARCAPPIRTCSRRGRYPAVVLFLEVAADSVDVNVHPAKAEVRFRDSRAVQGLIVGALRHALAEAGHRASTTVATAALGAMRPGGGGPARGLRYDAPAARLRRGVARGSARLPGTSRGRGGGGGRAH